MTYETIRTTLDQGLLWLELNRPDKLNAFTVTMAEELIAEFNRASEDDSVRVIVVTGAGRAFCAGMDLSVPGNVFGLDESMRPTPAGLEAHFDDPAWVSGVRDTGGRVALAILACRKPTIAAINGAAVGIGATMTLSMDIRLASDKARIGFVFAQVGIAPEACSTWLLPRLVGPSQALEWFYRAQPFDAAEALRGGLVRSVLPEAELRGEAERLARSFIDGRSAVSAAQIRRMVYQHLGPVDPVQAHKAESLAMFHASLADGKEGVRAFLERRPPKFEALPSAAPDIFNDKGETS